MRSLSKLKLRNVFSMVLVGAAFVAPTQAAVVSVSFEVLGFSANFAEHSTLITSPAGAGANANLTVWQGGVVRFNGPGVDPTTIEIPLAPGSESPLTEVSPSGVLHSTPISHVISAPTGATGVTFADRLGWRTPDGSTFFAAFDTSASRDNVLSFEPTQPVDVARGEIFRLGTFSMRNGSWHSANNGAPDPVQILFRLTTRSADPLFDGFSVVDSFVFETIAVQGGTALENADNFRLLGRPELGTIRVLEQQTGTIDLFGSINSLNLVSFGNPTGGVVLTSTGVPEPATLALLMSALGVLALLRRRAFEPRLSVQALA